MIFNYELFFEKKTRNKCKKKKNKEKKNKAESKNMPIAGLEPGSPAWKAKIRANWLRRPDAKCCQK